MLSRAVVGWQVASHLGLRWIAFRTASALQQRFGYFERKLPKRSWDDRVLCDFLHDQALSSPKLYFQYRAQCQSRFFFSGKDRTKDGELLRKLDERSGSSNASAELAAGEFVHFSYHKLPRGIPPDWHLDPFSGRSFPKEPHWSRINELGAVDVKLVWELNRFGFAYQLVRSYWRTGNVDLPELFWNLVESWREQNPPQAGINWKCGQEISFRLMAWLFGFYGFSDARATTPERVAMLAQMIALSAERINAHFQYALSQKNNHGVSEALGLWTTGTLFPEFRASGLWQEKGRRWLESLGHELIYDEGGFSQTSANYQRTVFHDYLWCLRLGELNSQPFSAELRDRVGKLSDSLYQLQDEITGRVPNYGQNDGALVLPLNGCDFQDFRPATQAGNYLARGCRCHEPGPWDEDLLWLFGPESLASPMRPRARFDFCAASGAGSTLRSGEGFAFVRHGQFRHRPSQADLLHTEVWWKGCAIARDAGTYSYNAPPPWDNPLAHTQYHNTVTVDGLNQMDRVSRFLWLPWANNRIRVQRASPSGRLHYWEAEHDGYRRLTNPAAHRRAVLGLTDETWIVLDYLQSSVEHVYRLHWLLSMAPHHWNPEAGELDLELPAGSYFVRLGALTGVGKPSLATADKESPRGWVAQYYHQREAALSLELSRKASRVWFYTCFSPKRFVLKAEGTKVQIHTSDWRCALELSGENASLAQSLSLNGSVEEQWEISA